jgi:hypothetical protein
MGVLTGGSGKVRVSNQTGGTSFCRITVGKGPDYENHVEKIPAGQAGEVTFRAGPQNVCVFACEQSAAYDGTTSDSVGCKEIVLDRKTPHEIVVFDGPTKPDLPTTPGYQQIVWENNLNPIFKENRNKLWLTPYGQIVNGRFHATIEDSGVCPKTVHVQTEDRKASRDREPVDPKQNVDLDSAHPPIWLSFGLDAGLRDLHRVYDLPTGAYRFRVRDDCRGLDLVDARYPEGATEKAKPTSGAPGD